MVVREIISKSGKSRILKFVVTSILVVVALHLRLAVFSEKGGDPKTFTDAVDSFLDGKNIYNETVKSYSQGATEDHEYAYFPTLLYLHSPLYLLSDALHIEPHVLFKIPVLIADILVGFLIFEILCEEEKKLLGRFSGIVVLIFKPYLIVINSYTYSELLRILFMILVLRYLEKDDIKAGIFYAISFSLKSFSLVFFPLFILKSKRKVKFLLAGFAFAFLISIPFMKSINDFITYLQGLNIFRYFLEPWFHFFFILKRKLPINISWLQ